MKFQILGSIQLRHGGRQLPLGRAKERALLGVLLLNHHKRVTTDTLLQALWDHDAPDHALKSLQAYVSRLRKSLRSHGCTAEIVTQHHAYVLHADDDQIDLTQFKALRASAEAARRAGRADEAARYLYEAIDLWQGPPLADLHTSWAELAREDLDAYHRLPGYQLLCAVELDRGNVYDALELLDTVSSGHELDTRCISLRLSTLNAAGHYAEFDSYWQHIYRRTVEAFGTGPGRELRQLHQQLLYERDALISEHPAVASVPAPLPPPAQLPPTIDDFVGRFEQLRELEALLAQAQLARQPTTLIIAITGGPGAGKTTLALQWAHSIRDRFPAGQLYADLRGYADTPPRDPGEVIGEFLQAFGMPAGQIPTSLDARSGLFRSMLAGQNALLVLDDAQDPAQLLPLLPGASGCVVVITSRHRLTSLVSQRGARRVALPPLLPAERLELLRMIFARSHRQRTDPAALAGMAELSTGLPLAVRLLSERAIDLADMPLTDLVTALRAMPSALAAIDDSHDSADALRASLTRSYRVFAPDTARLFRLLSLHPGDEFSAEVAAASLGATVTACEPLLRAMASLHLIEPVGVRFVLPSLIRAYAAELARDTDPRQELDDVGVRMLDWYWSGASSADHAVHPHRSQRVDLAPPVTAPAVLLGSGPEAMAWLTTERSNLRAAVDLAATHGLPHAWRMPVLLRELYLLNNFRADWKHTHQVALAAAQQAGDEQGEAGIHLGLALLARLNDEPAESLDGLLSALELFSKAGNRRGEATTRHYLGNHYRHDRDYERAQAFYDHALRLRVQENDLSGQSATLHAWGAMMAEQGHAGQAQEFLQRALDIRRRIHYHVGQASTLTELGLLADAEGDTDTALTVLDEVVQLQETQTADHEDVVRALTTLADIHADRGDYAQAAARARYAIGLCHPHNDREHAVRAMTTLSEALHHLGRHDEARDEARQARELLTNLDTTAATDTMIARLAPLSDTEPDPDTDD